MPFEPDQSPPPSPYGPSPCVPGGPHDDSPSLELAQTQPTLVASHRRQRGWLHLLLFLLTFVTTTVAGALHYHAFLSELGAHEIAFSLLTFLPQGAWYSVTILAILGAHELGHYLACRYYRVDASLPYFIPAPVPLTGTLGAFIRIREPIRTKRMLFDIGVAGPIAGFLIAVPALFLGLGLSTVAPLPDDFVGLSLGEPLLFRLSARLIWGSVADGYSLNLHPMAFAAWFGLLATALNLFPIGQLDGGHISYAALGRRSTIVTLGSVVVTVLLTFWSTSWLVWTTLMVAMLFIFGPRHPRTVDEQVPLDLARKVLAVVAIVMFVLCFSPAPIEPLELLEKP